MSRLNSFRQLVTGFAIAVAATTPVEAATIAVGPYAVSTTMPFVVPVVVTGAIALDAFTFDLAYDPGSFAINTACDPFAADPYCDLQTGPVTQGSFFTATALFSPLFNPGFILLDGTARQIGQLLAVNGAWQDSGAGPSGQGVLAWIEFIATAGGSSTSPITIGGGQPALVPEPGTLLLMPGAFLPLLLRQRRRSRQAIRRDAGVPTSHFLENQS